MPCFLFWTLLTTTTTTTVRRLIDPRQILFYEDRHSVYQMNTIISTTLISTPSYVRLILVHPMWNEFWPARRCWLISDWNPKGWESTSKRHNEYIIRNLHPLGLSFVQINISSSQLLSFVDFHWPVPLSDQPLHSWVLLVYISRRHCAQTNRSILPKCLQLLSHFSVFLAFPQSSFYLLHLSSLDLRARVKRLHSI